MNKMKRLFSPVALAATVATGLLVYSVWADESYSAPLYGYDPHCTDPYGLECMKYDGGSQPYYWCCSSTNYECGDLDTSSPPHWGWCNPVNTNGPIRR